MVRRNLILIHRPGAGYIRDFDEISAKTHVLDPSIVIFTLPANLKADLGAQNWRYPTLTIALTSNFRLPILRGRLLKSQQVEKLAQQAVFRRNAIPTPPALPFQFGMTLDPIIFGEFVVLKPMDLEQTSQGNGVQMFRRRRLHQMRISDFPENHPIHRARQGYIVQRFVDTGENPSFFRVQTFLGKAIYAWHSTLVEPRCSLAADDADIERANIASQGGEKTRKLIDDPDIITLAEKVHGAFPHIPMLAVDIIRETATGKLYVLECNPGGNTWHFSSEIGEKLRMGFGDARTHGNEKANEIARRMFIDQFGAFDIVARRLVAATHELAS
jgi:hypothetical protein